MPKIHKPSVGINSDASWDKGSGMLSDGASRAPLENRVAASIELENVIRNRQAARSEKAGE